MASRLHARNSCSATNTRTSACGNVSFDKYGDITGPFRLWRIKDGEVTTVGEMSADDVGKIKSELK